MFELRKKGYDAEIYYQNKIREKIAQEKKLSEISNQIQVYQGLHNESQSESPLLKEKDEEISENLDRMKTEIPSLLSTKFLLVTEKSKLENSIEENETQMRELEIEKHRKMELLKQKFRDVYEGVIWLEENKDKFSASVHQPMFLTLKVNQEDNRKYIENLVGARDLLAFICENKEDSKLLTRILRLEKNLNVNIVMVPDNPIEYYKSPNLTPELKQLGVINFLKDVIEAPSSIKRFLYHCYNLHSIPLCSKLAEQNMNQLFLHDSKISLFFTPDAKIAGKRSKYGNKNFCIRKDHLKFHNFLFCSKDNSEKLHHLQTQLQLEKNQLDLVNEKLKTIEIEINELGKKEKALKEEKIELVKKSKMYTNAERQLNQKINIYERKKVELVNEDEEKAKLTNLIQNINKEKMTIYLNISGSFEKFLKWTRKKLGFNLIARLSQKVLTNNRKLQNDLEKEIEELEKKFEDLATKGRELKKEGIDLRTDILVWQKPYEEAKKKCLFNFFSIENKEEIIKEICRAQAYLDLNCDENETGTANYKVLTEKIAKTEELIAKHEQTLNEFQAEIMKRRNLWLPQIQTHIQNINSKFSEYYKQLNYSGEIILDTCNDTDDFPNYGLQITLKYRDSEPLLELSHTRHSGGECSVAAIIFILSLQGFTNIPFRCIDEINQGMDSENERNMYNLIAQSAKSESYLQYFILTPKLLMNLEMIEQKDVTVHVIYNSIFLGMKINVAEDLNS